MPRPCLPVACLPVACLLIACLLLLCRSALAAPDSVVLVPTTGPKSWPAAEHRLSAELQALGVRLIVLPARTESDHELARHVRAFGALAAVQVLRVGDKGTIDRGVIRVWLERTPHQSGGFRHVAVSLRNQEVVSQAVLPVVELVNEHLLASLASESTWVEETATTRSASDVLRNAPKRLGAPVFGPPVRYHVRSEMQHALRLGVGPWFSGAETTPAIQATLGVRAHWFRLWSLEPELFVHGLAHRVKTENGSGQLRYFGGRLHLLFEPWPVSTVSFGVGPGVGFTVVEREGALAALGSEVTSQVSARAELASALMPFIDVLFVLTLSRAMTEVAGHAAPHPDAPLMRIAVDSMLAVDWHFD